MKTAYINFSRCYGYIVTQTLKTINFISRNRKFISRLQITSILYENYKTLLLKTRDLDSIVAPDDTTLEELKDAVVTGIFLQCNEDSYVEEQSITDIKLCLYDAANNDSRVFLNKKAFKNADLGEYYDIIWEE